MASLRAVGATSYGGRGCGDMATCRDSPASRKTLKSRLSASQQFVAAGVPVMRTIPRPTTAGLCRLAVVHCRPRARCRAFLLEQVPPD
jgi:hypothetical protein